MYRARYLLLGLALSLAAARAAEPIRTGVLIVPHGAPAEAWNRLPRQVAKAVAERVADGPYAVEIGFLEFANPSVAEGVRALEAAGAAHIVAVPLFISHSGHTALDLPCLLGLAWDAETMKTLAGEGAELVKTELPITVTQPMSVGALLPELILERVKEVSTAPAEEAVLLTYHGAGGWEPLLHETFDAVEAMLNDAGYAAVGRYAGGTGAHGAEEFGAAIAALAGGGRRVIVAAVFVGTSGEEFIARAKPELADGVRVLGTKRALVPDDKVAAWVIASAQAVRERYLAEGG